MVFRGCVSERHRFRCLPVPLELDGVHLIWGSERPLPFINWFIADLILWGAFGAVPGAISTAWLFGTVMVRAANFRMWRRTLKSNPFVMQLILSRKRLRSFRGTAQVYNDADFGKSFEDSFRELKLNLASNAFMRRRLHLCSAIAAGLIGT